MKILLAYSKAHFDPHKSAKEHKYLGSSANILASNLYESLGSIGDVTYIDSWLPDDLESVKGQTFDVFIGIIDKFSTIAEQIICDKNILFAVNAHPSYRNATLNQFKTRQNLSDSALNSWDIIDEEKFVGSVELADYIIGVGDNVTYNSFIEHGVAKQKIKMLNYGVNAPSSVSKAKPNRFLFLASDVGLRKGFDVIASLFSDPALAKQDFHLDIVGPIHTKHHQALLRILEETLGKKVSYHGWVDVASKEFAAILKSNAYLVSPAVEEGQAGAVLDCLNQGLVPILSPYNGVPFSPLGLLEPVIGSARNVSLILDALKVTPAQLQSLRTHAKRYYQEFHADFKHDMRETLTNVITTGHLYPKISVVLPIFNKENTIEDLLDNLDRSCAIYGNTELHIIFDGCKDKTEKIVRNFYKDRHSYPVTYQTTPNIFEVKSNNIGLHKSTGKYAAIIQDDNFIYDRSLFFETAMLLDKNSRIAILGGLAGVNFYPRGTKNLQGPGQIALNENEAYWRQDENTNPEFKHQYYEVDACMRGPLIFRKSFLDEHGYLDEAYAPFYMDDMDICFRARDLGYHVYTALFEVKNLSHTVATYNTEERKKFWEDTMKRTADLFYSRWKPTTMKDYDWTWRTAIADSSQDVADEAAFKLAVHERNSKRARKHERRHKLLLPASKTKKGVYAIARRVKRKISA